MTDEALKRHIDQNKFESTVLNEPESMHALVRPVYPLPLSLVIPIYPLLLSLVIPYWPLSTRTSAPIVIPPPLSLSPSAVTGRG